MIRVGLGAALALLCGAAHAAASPSACGTEDLLLGKRPVQVFDVRGNLLQLTDGKRAAEGTDWNAPSAAVLDNGASSLTWDLGEPTPVAAVYLQADANDVYQVSGSVDGVSYTPFGTAVLLDGGGLRGRLMVRTPMTLRYLRIDKPAGDGLFSISEVAAFCSPPDPQLPSLAWLPRPPSAPQPARWWNNDASARVELVIAIAGLLVLAYGVRRRDRRFDVALMLLGAVSFGAYFNFGSFHFSGYVHQWDTFHYYIGGKYFDELSYDRLYECAAVADSEDPLWEKRVVARTLRDLRSNEVIPTADILAHPDRCKEHFSPERWEAFKHDVGYFRTHFGPSDWERVNIDHGYNATPVWTLLGAALANTAPVSDGQLWWLTRIDPFLFCAMLALIGWAFGWRVLCVALLVLATNFPSRFYWTGGSFLRWDWLFYLAASVCLLRRKMPLAAGLAIGYAALLRIFPGFLVVGPLLLLVHAWRTRAPLDRRLVRFVAGAAICVAVLFPISLASHGGVATARAFVQNSVKHVATPLTNHMGWRSVVSWDPRHVGRFLRTSRDVDPWHRWKEARRANFSARRWVYLLGVLGALVLLWRAVRDQEPWVAAAASASLIAVVPELTCYYYAFLVAVALLWERDRRVGVVLMLMTAGTGVVAWAPTEYLPWRWLHLIPTWDDERYVLMSVLTLAALAWVLRIIAQPVRSSASSPTS
jgi:hypothetical protein